MGFHYRESAKEMPDPQIIDHAFILAAGMGKRLRPYTDQCPKPLVKVAGRAIIDHVLESLEDAGVRHVTVNTHYMADMLEAYLSHRTAPQVVFSREGTLLDTGGGIKKALPLLGARPFFAVSGDSFWSDPAGAGTLADMARLWEPAKMDVLIGLAPLSRMALTPGLGDYTMDAAGGCIRSLDKTGTHMWTSIRLCAPSIFKDTPDTPFSFLDLMDRAEKRGRLYGHVLSGEWYHITTPEDLERVDAALSAQKKAAG